MTIRRSDRIRDKNVNKDLQSYQNSIKINNKKLKLKSRKNNTKNQLNKGEKKGKALKMK